MQYQPNPAQVKSLISRRMQISFFVGLFLGIFLGWAFSGVVGAVMRFGIVVVLLVPLVLAIMFWWKVRQAPKVEGTTIVTWGNTGLPPMDRDPFGTTSHSARNLDEDIIDLEQLRKERKS